MKFKVGDLVMMADKYIKGSVLVRIKEVYETDSFDQFCSIVDSIDKVEEKGSNSKIKLENYPVRKYEIRKVTKLEKALK